MKKNDLFEMGARVHIIGNRDVFCYLGYNDRTKLHEIASVGHMTEAKGENLVRAGRRSASAKLPRVVEEEA